jgi:AraC-like DNA-binding protein
VTRLRGSEPIRESVRALAAPALRDMVAFYSGYRQEGIAPGSHKGLPSPFLTFIVTLDHPLTVASHPTPRQPPGRYVTLLGGLHSRPAVITHDGYQSGIQICLSPLGARALLGMPAGELAEIDLDATDVLGSFALELHDRVRGATTWDERFAVADQMLAERAQPDRAPPAPVVHAWRLLNARDGAPSVREVAREVGWSRRHLMDRFRSELGLTPKVAGRVARFDRARRLLARRVAARHAPALADLAAACGYYDQAHLAREFRELAGCPPSQWLSEELPNVQGADAGDLPESSHE